MEGYNLPKAGQLLTLKISLHSIAFLLPWPDNVFSSWMKDWSTSFCIVFVILQSPANVYYRK
jgi:hypothetical protein